jgi:hypothetical protein
MKKYKNKYAFVILIRCLAEKVRLIDVATAMLGTIPFGEGHHANSLQPFQKFYLILVTSSKLWQPQMQLQPK